MKFFGKFIAFSVFVTFLSCQPQQKKNTTKLNISGVYPHLAYYNNEGECGTGAVVSWAGNLWVITYGPHLPFGSSDKLYQITPDLQQITRPESVGGTPAARMIHKEIKYYPKRSAGVEILLAACYTLASVFMWNKGSD